MMSALSSASASASLSSRGGIPVIWRSCCWRGRRYPASASSLRRGVSRPLNSSFVIILRRPELHFEFDSS